jgi:penicillin-insensitive murein endopeptidase
VRLVHTCVFALAGLSFILPASAGTVSKPTPRTASRSAKLEVPAQRAASGQSVGSPTDGHLLGGAHLTEGPALRVMPIYAGGDVRWGLESLVNLVEHAARSVRKQYPDAVLSVGHLSRAGGGELDRHASHESGRDADLGFYVKNEQGKPIFAEHFVAFKADGTSDSWPGARFDDAKNWALVSAIATYPHAQVTHIFVAAPLRQRLLAYAEKSGVSASVRSRAAELMAQPRGSLPHDDHFHVRIGCPAGMTRCVEEPLAHRRTPSMSGKGAVASSHIGSPLGGKGRAASSGSPSVRGPQAPRKPNAPTRPEAHASPRRGGTEEPASKLEALIPSLAPIVPGLDTAIIPKPIEHGSQASNPFAGTPLEALVPGLSAPPASGDESPIDDPDGVLEGSR